MNNLVYLAGPITGLTFGDATDWRNDVKKMLPPWIHTLSPLRGKQYLEERSSRDGRILDSYENYPLSSARGITTRDRWDATRCNVLLVNLLGATRVSIGTVEEIGWADAKRIPTILVMEDEGNLHDHSMIRESVGFRVNSLSQAVEILIALLSTDQQLDQLSAKKRLDEECAKRVSMWKQPALPFDDELIKKATPKEPNPLTRTSNSEVGWRPQLQQAELEQARDFVPQATSPISGETDADTIIATHYALNARDEKCGYQAQSVYERVDEKMPNLGIPQP